MMRQLGFFSLIVGLAFVLSLVSGCTDGARDRAAAVVAQPACVVLCKGVVASMAVSKGVSP
jgi:hypothetical protein